MVVVTSKKRDAESGSSPSPGRSAGESVTRAVHAPDGETRPPTGPRGSRHTRRCRRRSRGVVGSSGRFRTHRARARLVTAASAGEAALVTTAAESVVGEGVSVERVRCRLRALFVRYAHQNFRFSLTASRFSAWICSVSGMSFGQTFVQENCVWQRQTPFSRSMISRRSRFFSEPSRSSIAKR